jgi:hypothetical protein
MSPQRIQLKSTAGWRLPEGVILCDPRTRWGNPFRLVNRRGPGALVREPGVLTGQPWEYEGRISADGARHDYRHPNGKITACYVRYATATEVVELYRRALLRVPDEALRMSWPTARPTTLRAMPVKVTVDDVRRELAGKDLGCWCPIEDVLGNPYPCHADVLLAVARGETPERWTP